MSGAGSALCPPRNEKQIPHFARNDNLLKEIFVAFLRVYRILRVKRVLGASVVNAFPATHSFPGKSSS